MGRRRQPLEPELRSLSARMRVLAEATGGVITAAQARPLGADRAAIRRLLTCGEWARGRRGVYRDLRLDLPVELDRPTTSGAPRCWPRRPPWPSSPTQAQPGC